MTLERIVVVCVTMICCMAIYFMGPEAKNVVVPAVSGLVGFLGRDALHRLSNKGTGK